MASSSVPHLSAAQHLGTSLQQSTPALPHLYLNQPLAGTAQSPFAQVPPAQPIVAQTSGQNFPLSAEELRVKLISEEKFLEDRIAHVERHFSALATGLGAVVRKTAHLRNKGDTIVKTLHDFANNEGGEVRACLMAVADCFSALEDCSDMKIERMESRVVKPLLEYGGTCRKARDEVRMIHNSGEKEVFKRKTAEKVKISYPTNRKKISQSESELQKAKVDRMRTAKAVEDYMMEFERKRTKDLKLVLLEYIHSQMTYHARAIELFTAAYQKTLSIQEQEVTDKYLMNLASRKIQNAPSQARPGSPTLRTHHMMGSSTPVGSTTPIHSTPTHSIPSSTAYSLPNPTQTL